MSSLTEPQVEHYFREGYVLVPDLIPRRAIDAVMAVAAGRVRGGDFWQPTIFDHARPEAEPVLHRLLWEPAVEAAAAQLLGPFPRVYYGMLAVVPPRGGRGLPWHQDNQYTTILGRGGALNVFIALGDITPEMGNLWIAPRSHLSGTRPAKAAEDHQGHREAIDPPDNGLCLPALAAGDACIFDRNTLHRSLRNETDHPRFAYAAQFQADEARQAATGKKDPARMRVVDLRAQVSNAEKQEALETQKMRAGT